MYFTWGEGPVLLDSTCKSDLGYFLTSGSVNWIVAAPSQVDDLFVASSKFLKMILRKSLPNLKALPELPEVALPL